MINNLEIWEGMDKKGLIKRVKYLPGKELSIDGIQKKYQWIDFFSLILFFILFVFVVNLTPLLTFPLFALAAFLRYKKEQRALVSQLLRFEAKRLYVAEGDEKEAEQSYSVLLKTPLFLDIVVKSGKKNIYISFEQYGEIIGNAEIVSTDLPFIIDSLEDFYDLEVYDSRSTSKEEILLLRPKNIAELLMLSFVRVTEDSLRLIVNPTSNRHNFMVNYQRRLIKTAKNELIPIADINKIKFWIKGSSITVNIIMNDKSVRELIKFKTKEYQEEIINKDVKLLLDFLESKPIFQNIIFEIFNY